MGLIFAFSPTKGWRTLVVGVLRSLFFALETCIDFDNPIPYNLVDGVHKDKMRIMVYLKSGNFAGRFGVLTGIRQYLCCGERKRGGPVFGLIDLVRRKSIADAILAGDFADLNSLEKDGSCGLVITEVAPVKTNLLQELGMDTNK